MEAEDARSRGALLFQIHCGSCHGLSGRGDGPVAEQLLLQPVDLSDLLEPDDSGALGFPAERLRSVIDGRDEVSAHGTRAMPIWGVTFQDAGRAENQEDLVLARVNDLVEYLRTLQETESDEPPPERNSD